MTPPTPSEIAAAAPAELPGVLVQVVAMQAELLAKQAELSVLQAAVVARMLAEAEPADALDEDGDEPDVMLDAAAAAGMLGHSKRWLYDHARGLPFTRKLAGGSLRFSKRGIVRYLERQRR